MSDRPSNGGSAGYCGGTVRRRYIVRRLYQRLRRQSGHRVHPYGPRGGKGAS